MSQRQHLMATALAIVITTGLAASAHAAPFTAGNLAIYRVHDGSSAVSNAGTAVFIDEYTSAGTLVQSIAMPTTVSGPNRRLVAQGTASLEGLINRSVDGRYLFVTGYDTDLGTATPAMTLASDINRVVGRLDANGSVDTSTVLTDLDGGADASPTQSGSPRSAISTNGTDLWVTGAEGGVRFASVGNTGPTTQVNTDIVNLRHVDIFGGQLYISTMSGSTVRIGTVGTGLPTTSDQTIASLPGVPGTGTPNPSPVEFFMTDLSNTEPGIDTLYVADDRGENSDGGLHKFSLVGGAWSQTGSISGVHTPAVSALRGLTGTVSGAEVTLFATRASNTLMRFVDTSGYNGTLSGEGVVLATAATNTQFKGLDFVPVAPPGGLTGDYNGNLVVDAADYVVWRNTLNQNVPNGTGADGDGNGIIEQADYGIWAANFGETPGAGAGLGLGLVVPEPNVVALAVIAMLSLCGGASRRR